MQSHAFSLDRMKIGTRVALGFLAILVIFIAASIYSLDNFRQSKNSFSEYSKFSSETTAILEIDRQVSEMQRIILAYSNTGHDGIIGRVKKSHQALLSDLRTMQATMKDDNRLSILRNMTKKLEDYGENIDALVEAREERDKITETSMKLYAEEFSEIVMNMKLIPGQKLTEDRSELIHLVHESMLRAQVDAVSFLSSRNHSLLVRSKSSLAEAKKLATVLSGREGPGSDFSTLSLRLSENITSYENTFYRAVQSTRSYLFLVNIVMAGEANEFTTLSKMLKDSTLSTLESLTSTTKTRLDEAQNTTFVVTITTTVFGVLLAVFVGRSLSEPIRQIATTFTELAREKRDVKIPGINRGDEIGQLAKAANVFKDMNERTKVILEESQSLANELTQREKQLEQQALELQKSNDELDNFAYVASHDLKSPLRAIDSLSNWIQEDCEDILPEESKEHLTKMQQRVKRMESLLSDLLNYSRVGRVDVLVDTIKVNDLVKNVIELIECPETIKIDVDVELPEITTQVSPLQQVFLNLLTNAIKYNDKDSGKITVNGRLTSDEYAEFSVSDNGPGIEPKYHKRIFQMFQTLQPRDVIESSGMGLAIIKKVIEGQGGEIRLDSSLGAGAIFRFTWPTKLNV